MTYEFTPEGFTLINAKGEPYYREAVPLFEKVVSHCLWIMLWTGMIFITRLMTTLLDSFWMSLIFGHLFFLGCRLTTLFLRGGIKAILFPPLFIRLTRRLEKGEGIELLKKYGLEEHPGLLYIVESNSKDTFGPSQSSRVPNVSFELDSTITWH